MAKRTAEMDKKTDILDEALCWFKNKYGIKKYSFVLRQYLTKSVIKNEKRYKVVEMYQDKIDGHYFVVYRNVPVKDKKYNSKTYA